MEALPSVKTRTPKLIARRHGVELDVILQQLEMGTKIEQEHTKNPKMAREIALDHLLELPDYYTRLQKMEESDIQDILHRSGIQVEADESRRKLDKFENLITDIALRLIDEDDDMDAASAGMDILDAINANIMTESLRRNAGMWYDPLKRALEILEDELPEDAFSDMKAQMAAQADEYLKKRDSSMSMADTQPGASDPGPEEEKTSLGAIAAELDNIRRTAVRDEYHVGRESLLKLSQIIQTLNGMETTAGQGIGMRFKKWFGEEAELRKRAGLETECQCELMEDYGMNSSSGDTLAQVIPELRGIAMHYVEDKASKQRLQEIAKQLSALKTQLGSSI